VIWFIRKRKLRRKLLVVPTNTGLLDTPKLQEIKKNYEETKKPENNDEDLESSSKILKNIENITKEEPKEEENMKSSSEKDNNESPEKKDGKLSKSCVNFNKKPSKINEEKVYPYEDSKLLFEKVEKSGNKHKKNRLSMKNEQKEMLLTDGMPKNNEELVFYNRSTSFIPDFLEKKQESMKKTPEIYRKTTEIKRKQSDNYEKLRVLDLE